MEREEAIPSTAMILVTINDDFGKMVVTEEWLNQGNEIMVEDMEGEKIGHLVEKESSRRILNNIQRIRHHVRRVF